MLFHLDGVVAGTAELQAQAWQQLLDPVLERHLGVAAAATPFDPVADYRRYFAGRTGRDGVTAFLADRGITLAAGRLGDQQDLETVTSLAERHSRLSSSAPSSNRVRAFPGTAALLDRLAAGGVPVGLVSGSGHAASVLAAARLAGSFDVVVGGSGAVVGGDTSPGPPAG
ncbi:MAG TPA: haloacid dehalogenase, partial [Propionibacteriaceae bacterium]|nr:haloacid dehalogenase [Propionibacteriaceae bacterium]